MKRRKFLSLSAVGGVMGGAMAALNPLLADNMAQGGAPNNRANAEVQLTDSIKCSRIGFGTGMRGSNRQSDLTRAGWTKATDLLLFAYDNGIRLFDLADLYGTHFVFAEAMKGKPRDSYTIISKVWLRPGGIPELERLDPAQTLTRFLRELKTDYIDLLQVHCVSDANWTSEFADAMASMEKLKEKGLIRGHGISTHSNTATEIAAKNKWCDAIHVRINSEGMNMDGPKDNAEARVSETLACIESAHKAGKGIIAMKVLGEGKMAGDPEMRKKSTKFVSEIPGVDVMIVGFTEREHISEFLENVKSV